jgi:hypothetical protein
LKSLAVIRKSGKEERMKYYVKVLMFLLVTIVLLGAGTATLKAQCVKCNVNESTWCWECVASDESAAIRCPEVSCYSCRSNGVCIIQNGIGGQNSQEIGASVQSIVRPACDSKTLEAIARDDAALRMAPLKFDPQIIREIAAVHPRFAATLASYNRTGGLSYKVSHQAWTPIELEAADVEWWFKSSEDASPFFSSLCQKAQPVNKLIRSGEVIPIVYDISVTESADSATRVISLQAASRSAIDPPYSLLEIVVTDGGLGGTSNAGQSTMSWRIK